MRIAVNNPSVLLQEDPTRLFHGYSIPFLLRYADYIYVHTRERGELFARRLKAFGIERKIGIINSIEELSNCADVLVSFGCSKSGTFQLELFPGLKFCHVTDYYMWTEKKYKFLLDIKADYIISHNQCDIRSEFFKQYYPNYIGKVINLPFGYAPRYKNIVPFNGRINKAVGLGAINMVKDAMASEDDTKEAVEFFKGWEYTHLTRKYIQDHQVELMDCIDAMFPTPEQQKDFSYDAVERLNSYRMFINDAGMSNFPPARTFEGIACGCVMVAADNPIDRKSVV